MRYRRVVLALVTVLAWLLPATVLAQTGGLDGNTFTLWAQLRGDTGVPDPGDPDGFGFARVTIDLDAGTLCYQLSVANINPATAAHIHEGGGGVAGPVVVPFEAPETGLISACAEGVDGALLAAIVANPGGYYVNVHNADFPGGAVRGQLMPLGYTPAPVEPGPSWEIVPVVEGLANPRGLDWGDDTNLYVAESGGGGEECVTVPEEEPFDVCVGDTGAVTHVMMDGTTEQVGPGLPSYNQDGDPSFTTGPHDMAVGADGTTWVVVGMGAPPALFDEILGDLAAGFGVLHMIAPDGTVTEVADIADFENTENPDGSESPDSNPYAVEMDGDTALVVDAGANALFTVTPDGTVSTYAIFPIEMVEPPPDLGLPPGELFPMDAVPTAVAVGPDGAYYVAQLTGFPFPVGGAKIWRLEDLDGDGDALEEGEMTVYASGLTALIDLEFAADGELYALSFAKNGLLAAETAPPGDEEAVTGALYHVHADGTHEEIVSTGLILPGGLETSEDGSFYVTNGSVFPDGQVVHVMMVEPEE